MVIAPGTRVGKYEVRHLLGQGGFGMVFAVHDTKLDRDCAMKFLLPEHTTRPEILQRFLKEARSAAKIKHGGIVTVFECDVVEGSGPGLDGMAYIAMELLDGESLSDRLKRGPMPIDQAVEVSRQVASALAAAHAVGIIHRDLKPDNIYLVPDAATTLGERVKVLDFGIAKLAESEASGNAQKTSTHMIFGTPKYMSPEQCKSTAKVDERSDIYALGCILFEMVCGRAPFEGDAGELIAMQQLVQPPSARSLRADLPEPLDAAITSMLAKQPTLRPATMTDIVKQLGPPTANVSAVIPAVSTGAIAPTLAPDAPSMPEVPRFATEPPAGIARVAPTMPVEPRVIGPIATTSPRRSLVPFVALGGVVIAGIVGAVIVVGGGSSPQPVDAKLAVVDATVDRVAPAVVDQLIELRRKAMVAVEHRDCEELDRVRALARAVSPLVERELADLRCKGPPLPTSGPDPAQIYAMPAVGSIVLGSPAPVTIIEGSDYACPHCVRGHGLVTQARARYGARIQVVIRPFVVHQAALANSLALCAAARLGTPAQVAALDEAMRKLFFPSGTTRRSEASAFDPPTTTPANPPTVKCYEVGRCDNIDRLARGTGLDIDKLHAGMRACVEELDQARASWERFEVSGIPAFFINGRFISGAVPAELFNAVIDEELAKADGSTTRFETYYRDHVMATGIAKVDPATIVTRDVPDPLESTGVLSRPAGSASVTVAAITIGWGGSSNDPRARSRSKADADQLAEAIAAALRETDDPSTLLTELSEAGRRELTEVVKATPEQADMLDQLALRLRDGEVGLVRRPTGWVVVKRVTPTLDPLESADILARTPVTAHAKVKHILLSSNGITRGKRSRAELETLVHQTLGKLQNKAAFEPLMAELSEDAGSTDGKAYEITEAMVAGFIKLSYRLQVGEIGVVKTAFGIHIIKRVE